MPMRKSRWTGDAGRSIVCPRCDEALSTHQPDLSHPHRILGVCESCEAWFLLGDEKAEMRCLVEFRKTTVFGSESE